LRPRYGSPGKLDDILRDHFGRRQQMQKPFGALQLAARPLIRHMVQRQQHPIDFR